MKGCIQVNLFKIIDLSSLQSPATVYHPQQLKRIQLLLCQCLVLFGKAKKNVCFQWPDRPYLNLLMITNYVTINLFSDF